MITNKLKLFIKELIGKSIAINNNVKTFTKNKLYIFSFHEITDNPSFFQKRNHLFVTKKVFKKQLDYINRLFKIIQPSDLLLNTNIKNSALITFDDGYVNSFKYGLKIMTKSKITPIFFLNMSAVKNKTPLLPASLEYLEAHYNKYDHFIDEFNLNKPISLSIKPPQFQKFEKYIKLNKKKINSYQGKIISLDYLFKKQSHCNFYIADHLYEHYNCLSLTQKELIHLCKKNLKILKKFKNHINIFSFPNGVPGKCFNKKNVNWIKNLNYKKVLSNGNTANPDNIKFLLDRISLNNNDDTFNKFLFKIYQSTKRIN